ncbi:MAG: hypothetical protein RR359_00855 [Bacilli bacterium]
MKKEDRVIKSLKIISIVCAIILAIEIFYFWFTNYNFERKNTFYDSYNSVVLDKDKIIATGASQFRHSKFNEWQKGYEKGKVAIFNEDLKQIKEKQYKRGFNSVSYYTLPIKNGYITVGGGEYDKTQNKDHIKDAVITKYDKDLKKIWEKYFQELGDSKFVKVIPEGDDYIVVGQSIYENMELGNHITGGGIIIKYSKDGEVIWKNNYGGNKSGIFNDILKVNDGYIVVGKDAKDTGIILKYSLDGKQVWQKNYSFTDTLGFSKVVLYNDSYLVIGAKKISDNKYNAVIVNYDTTGNLIKEYMYGDSKHNEKFNSIIIDNDNIILVGQVGTVIPNKKDEKDIKYTYDGLIVNYDKDFKVLKKYFYKGNKEDHFTDIIKFNKNYIVSGYSNSKDKKLKTNGKDYKGILINYSLKENKEK